jgi:tetratricopeptide (TPR) repeat protein
MSIEPGARVSGVGERIRSLRVGQDLNQSDLAGPGVSASYVSLLESGRRQPTPKALHWLAQKLHTTVEFLETGADGWDDAQLELRFATLALSSGDALEAEERFRRLLDAPNADLAREAAWGRAAALEALGRLAEAAALYESLRSGALADASSASLLKVTVALSRCYREAGDLGRAIEVGEAALDRLGEYELSNSDLAVEVMCTLAFAYLERGDLVRAKQLLVRVERLADSLGNPKSRGAVYWNASVLAAEAGAPSDAVQLADRALALFGEGNDERNLARLKNARAALVLRHDSSRADEALAQLREARQVLVEIGSSVDVAYCETEISRALVLVGRPDEALTVAFEVLDRLGEGARLEQARARTALAYALCARGLTDEAFREYERSAEDLEQLGATREAARVLTEYSEMLEQAGHPGEALMVLRRALSSVALAAPFPVPEISSVDAGAGRRR